MEWLNLFLSYESINLNFIFQEQHPEKLEVACQDKLVVCLPEASSVRTDLGGLDSDFFDLHILREKVEEGWYSSINPSLPLIAELQEGNLLKLFSGNFTVCNNGFLLKILIKILRNCRNHHTQKNAVIEAPEPTFMFGLIN